MNYTRAADIVVFFHLFYAAYVFLGLLLVAAGIIRHWRWVRNFPFRISHLICTLVVGLEVGVGLICPLTRLENYFLRGGGGEGYQHSFFGNILSSLLYYDLSEWIFAVAYLVWAALAILLYLLAPPRRGKSKGGKT